MLPAKRPKVINASGNQASEVENVRLPEPVGAGANVQQTLPNPPAVNGANPPNPIQPVGAGANVQQTLPNPPAVNEANPPNPIQPGGAGANVQQILPNPPAVNGANAPNPIEPVEDGLDFLGFFQRSQEEPQNNRPVQDELVQHPWNVCGYVPREPVEKSEVRTALQWQEVGYKIEEINKSEKSLLIEKTRRALTFYQNDKHLSKNFLLSWLERKQFVTNLEARSKTLIRLIENLSEDIEIVYPWMSLAQSSRNWGKQIVVPPCDDKPQKATSGCERSLKRPQPFSNPHSTYRPCINFDPKKDDFITKVGFACGSYCSCKGKCGNNVLQHAKNPIYEFEVSWRNIRVGFGLKAMTFIPAGSPIMQYTGFIRNHCTRRSYSLKLHDPKNLGPLAEILKENLHPIIMRYYSNEYYVDLWEISNVARFLNHGCFPNVACYRVYANGLTPYDANIVLVALEDILPGTELLMDFGPDYLKGCTKTGVCGCGGLGCPSMTDVKTLVKFDNDAMKNLLRVRQMRVNGRRDELVGYESDPLAPIMV
ncbi:unnamed protein product [Caenorhabditis auriculariae]|uniref:SET domain-containing protein n=1 Tax=Caenorhabditis auriculariae TaxID=2777116 RepID=A0A8S1GWY6_9PELO|nr:unnamed protein product [Caenorhabditis auriculariae]